MGIYAPADFSDDATAPDVLRASDVNLDPDTEICDLAALMPVFCGCDSLLVRFLFCVFRKFPQKCLDDVV
jgi:hypothetical protein